jgi:hypothetical protein
MSALLLLNGSLQVSHLTALGRERKSAILASAMQRFAPASTVVGTKTAAAIPPTRASQIFPVGSISGAFR